MLPTVTYVLMHMVEIGDEEWGVPYGVYTSLEKARAVEERLSIIVPEYDSLGRGQYFWIMNTPVDPTAASLEPWFETDTPEED